MLKKIIDKITIVDHLPCHPLLKNKLNESFSVNEKLTAENLSEYLLLDPAFVFEFIKIANRDSFGYKGKISSIENSLEILDNELIKLILLQHPVLPDLELYKENTIEKLNDLINHTLEVYFLTQKILGVLSAKQQVSNDCIDELSTAAIIHDIGFFFLLYYFPQQYNFSIKSVMQKSKRKKIFEAVIDHSFVSSLLCKRWDIPSSIVNAIAFHHYPWLLDKSLDKDIDINVEKTIENKNDNKDLLGAEILYLADSISSSFYQLYTDENDIYTEDEYIIQRKHLLKILDKYNLDMTQIALIKSECQQSVFNLLEKNNLQFCRLVLNMKQKTWHKHIHLLVV